MTAVLLLAAALFPSMITAGLLWLGRRSRFARLPYYWKQCAIGLVFGGAAALSTEYGVDVGGAIMNVRDAAPLCAGLLFGAPAGIIAGVAGGLHRWLSVYWGGGEYTRLACSLATAIAGLFGAAMRKYMFEDKRPAWLGAFIVGATAEVVHMLLLFLTNMSDIQTAFPYVVKCAPVMIPLNAASVMLAAHIAAMLRKDAPRHMRKRISQLFQAWLLICVMIALGLTGYFTYALQTRVTRENTDALLRQGLAAIPRDMNEITDNTLLLYSGWIALDIDMAGEIDAAFMESLVAEYEVPEICVVNARGVITHSNIGQLVGVDLAADAQSARYLALLEAPEMAWAYAPAFYDASLHRAFAGTALSGGGFALIGYDQSFLREEIAKRIQTAATNKYIGQDGRLLIYDESGVIISDSQSNKGRHIKDIGIDTAGVGEYAAFRAKVYGADAACMLSTMPTLAGDYTVIAVLPMREARFFQDLSVCITLFIEVVIFAALFMLLYALVKRLVVNNIRSVNGALARITGGDLDVVVDVRQSEEFAALTDDINATVVTLKRYIAQAEARIDAELEFARQIQASALPSVFPPYPGRTDFEIFAAMHPAKEVGGDFYDFYLINDTLMFLVADVSGKGIPASLFMMKAKTQLKSLAENGLPLDEVFRRANEKLCEGNHVKMFVTAWMGALDLTTGALKYVSAGHNPPLVAAPDGAFEYLRGQNDFILAGLDFTRFRQREVTLRPGDTIFLYTDGVTEAADPDEALLGEGRLSEILRDAPDRTPRALCEYVKARIDAFARGEAQYDDITMLCVHFTGGGQ